MGRLAHRPLLLPCSALAPRHSAAVGCGLLRSRSPQPLHTPPCLAASQTMAMGGQRAARAAASTICTQQRLPLAWAASTTWISRDLDCTSTPRLQGWRRWGVGAPPHCPVNLLALLTQAGQGSRCCASWTPFLLGVLLLLATSPTHLPTCAGSGADSVRQSSQRYPLQRAGVSGGGMRAPPADGSVWCRPSRV